MALTRGAADRRVFVLGKKKRKGKGILAIFAGGSFASNKEVSVPLLNSKERKKQHEKLHGSYFGHQFLEMD
ncbi:hypothetical protein P8452_15917 [Trifolium repens]|nr:hypothetical protein P8452_15917 [Trifolium repens]